MTNKQSLLPLLAAAALAVGCNDTQTTSKQIDKVQEKTAEAVQDMKDYTFVQKAEFIAKMESQLAEIHKELDRLAAKVEKSNAAAKAEAQPKLQALRDQTAKLNQQLDDVRNASESTWGEVKAGFKKGYGEVKDGVNHARQWVSDKIAP